MQNSLQVVHHNEFYEKVQWHRLENLSVRSPGLQLLQHRPFFIIRIIKPMPHFICGAKAAFAKACLLINGADINAGRFNHA
jgi:hypothetical protein